MFGKFASKKKYIAMALAVLTAIAAYLTGDLALVDAITSVLDTTD